MEEYWDKYTEGEKALFQRVARRLLNNTFLVRDKDEEMRREYFFVARNPDAFNTFFGYIGMQVMLDRENGVVMLKNGADSGEGAKMQLGHLMLRKIDSLVLMCLWTIYADRLSAGRLSKAVMLTLPELRYELEKYGIRDQLDKTKMSGILALLARYNLLETSGVIGEEDFVIRLYPSLLFCLDMERFGAFVEQADKRMREGDAGEITEDADSVAQSVTEEEDEEEEHAEE